MFNIVQEPSANINLLAFLTVIMLLCLPNNCKLKHKQCKMIVLSSGGLRFSSSQVAKSAIYHLR